MSPHDWHATGEGYLRSPRDGSLRDLVRACLELERAAEVHVLRRLGLSVAYHLLAREQGDSAAWGGEWVESVPSGPQGWWPVSQCDDRVLDGLAGLGMTWLCLGASVGEEAGRLMRSADRAGLRVAARPGPAVLEAVESLDEGQRSAMTFESLPLLVDAFVTRESGAGPAESLSAAVRRIAVLPGEVLDRAERWIVASGVPVVPLLTAAGRRTSLRAVVNAPALTEAERVLPYHRRIASLRSPGALRLGGREASLHLGVPALDRAGERAAATGLDSCAQLRDRLLAAGHPVLPGSGAPGVGLAPGHALLEEVRHWPVPAPVGGTRG